MEGSVEQAGSRCNEAFRTAGSALGIRILDHAMVELGKGDELMQIGLYLGHGVSHLATATDERIGNSIETGDSGRGRLQHT